MVEKIKWNEKQNKSEDWYYENEDEEMIVFPRPFEDPRDLYIPVVFTEKHRLKELMDSITNKLDCYNIIFTSVISRRLKHKLEGFVFRLIYFDEIKDYVPCMEGKWKKDE